MKRNVNELIDTIYRYYPRGIDITNDKFAELRTASEENARLVATGRRAAVDERWRSMLRRASERFPGMLMNQSLYLHPKTECCDGGYSFTIDPHSYTGIDRESTLYFHISFLTHYYVVHRLRTISAIKKERTDSFFVVVHGLRIHVARSVFDPGAVSGFADDLVKSVTVSETCAEFDLLCDGRRCAELVAGDIKEIFGYEFLPPDIGKLPVPDVMTDSRFLGDATVYDCVFSDRHAWVEPSLSDVSAPVVEVDMNMVARPLMSVLKVIAASCHIAWVLTPKKDRGCWHVSTDGSLRKEWLAHWLDRLHSPIDETPIAVRARAAGAELEALVAAWDGNGSPTDAMVVWASDFLASWVVDEK
jgi:hypothetical protein